MEKFENLRKEIEEGLNDYSLDFVVDYSWNSYGYISDAISEFADRNTSIYYSEQRKFYYDNTELCENALLDFGYDLNQMLREGDTLDDLICKAGAIGEYMQIENILNDELEDIIKILIIDYIEANNIQCDIDILDNIDTYKLQKFDDIIDYINEYNQE